MATGQESNRVDYSDISEAARTLAQARGVWTVTCAGCEKRFQGTLRARYCGVTCRVRAWRARQRDGGDNGQGSG